MKRKNMFVVGIIALLLFVASTSVSYGGDKEICEKQMDHYLKIKMNDGLLPGDEFNPFDYKGVAKAAEAMIENEKKRTHNDKNHAAITKLVTTHLSKIQKAAAAAKPGSIEEVSYRLRFLYLSCKACHKVYQTEKRLRP